ncbi:hypothetical protein L195_g062459 [Trifolium pratense]|uniref:Uncharacterized protein n=1 Tax=Trifolium pratense TaxID=57577 RepID=A0A2K3KFY7_TRIPR|nr:hypothetical protein L195_g062459 [Trifolium pratense]
MNPFLCAQFCNTVGSATPIFVLAVQEPLRTSVTAYSRVRMQHKCGI